MTTGKNVKFLRASLERPHTVASASGDIACVLSRATLYHDGTRAVGFELELRCQYPEYQRLLDDGTFELSPENRGPILGGEDALRPGQPVTITVFLRGDRLAAHFSGPDAFESEAQDLLRAIASPANELARPEAWIFVSVNQRVPGHAFDIGYKHTAYQATDAHLRS